MKTILFTAIATLGLAIGTAAFAEGNDQAAPRNATFVSGPVRQDTGSDAMPVFSQTVQATQFAQTQTSIPNG
jgi:hypothetical protein